MQDRNLAIENVKKIVYGNGVKTSFYLLPLDAVS